jgi:hypothetical protein
LNAWKRNAVQADEGARKDHLQFARELFLLLKGDLIPIHGKNNTARIADVYV